MVKTIETKCKEGNHELLRFIGTQKGVGTLKNVPYCHDCNSRVKVTGAYRQVLKDVYELKTIS